jgi:hypothetical protein
VHILLGALAFLFGEHIYRLRTPLTAIDPVDGTGALRLALFHKVELDFERTGTQTLKCQFFLLSGPRYRNFRALRDSDVAYSNNPTEGLTAQGAKARGACHYFRVEGNRPKYGTGNVTDRAQNRCASARYGNVT